MLEWQAASGVRGAERLGGRSGVEWSEMEWRIQSNFRQNEIQRTGEGGGSAPPTPL